MRRDYTTALEITSEMGRANVASDAGYSSLAAYVVDATNMARSKATRMIA